MSEQESFEKWYKEKYYKYDLYPKYAQFRKEMKEVWQAATAEAYCQEKQRQQEPVAKINAQWSCPDSLGKKHRERYVQFKNGIIPQEDIELFTYPPDAAKVLEDKEREIAELKARLKIELKLADDDSIKIGGLRTRLTELQAHINDLREALEENHYSNSSDKAISLYNSAMSATPAQSLAEHDNEVIERCAKVIEPDAEHRKDASWGYIGGEEGVELLDNAAEKIRALKGTP